jgi:hypothetical protein
MNVVNFRTTVAIVGLLGLAALWPREAASHNPVTTTVLFNREIATLFNAKCNQCHSAGKLAMPLGTFAEARPWAQAIKEEALARHMPPWPAQRGVGSFANDIGLTIRELDFLISWVDGGTPEGEGTAPEFADHGAHWMMGTPDSQVVAPTAVEIAAGVRPHTRRILLDTGLTREAWLKGFDYKPGDARVTRAAFISLEGGNQFVGGWTPWAQTMQLRDGLGIKLPPGARLAIDVLYQSAGVTVMDRPRIGLYFTDRPASEVRTLTISSASPAYTLAQDASLLSLRVETPPDTRSLELRARRPDGSIEPLLRLKNVRQDWQTPFVFARPIPLPKGTTVQAVVKNASGATAPGLMVSVNWAPPSP